MSVLHRVQFWHGSPQERGKVLLYYIITSQSPNLTQLTSKVGQHFVLLCQYFTKSKSDTAYLKSRAKFHSTMSVLQKVQIWYGLPQNCSNTLLYYVSASQSPNLTRSTSKGQQHFTLLCQYFTKSTSDTTYLKIDATLLYYISISKSPNLTRPTSKVGQHTSPAIYVILGICQPATGR